MKHRTLEPGLLQVLKFLVVFQVFGVLLVRLPLGTAMGVEVTLVRWLWVTLTIPLFTGNIHMDTVVAEQIGARFFSITPCHRFDQFNPGKVFDPLLVHFTRTARAGRADVDREIVV